MSRPPQVIPLSKGDRAALGIFALHILTNNGWTPEGQDQFQDNVTEEAVLTLLNSTVQDVAFTAIDALPRVHKWEALRRLGRADEPDTEKQQQARGRLYAEIAKAQMELGRMYA